MAQPRILYEDGRPYTVPETLEERTVWSQLWLPRKIGQLWEGRLRTLPVA
jgi:hypothetical protein